MPDNKRPTRKRPARSAPGDESAQDGLERVQKVLSRCGIASRRASEALMRQGRIEVNGKVVAVGAQMRPGIDELRFDGEVVSAAPKAIVVLLNKPVGTLCSEKDPDGRPLVHHLVPPQLALRLVGRLDFNTEGVLLMTNDGGLSNKLSHPRHGVLRVYEARVRGIPSHETIARLVKGVVLDDGPARVENARVVKKTDRNAWVRLTLTEGRNREVRRLMEKVGHPVMRLRRVQFAGLGSEGMAPGQWRVLHDHEVEELRERGHIGAFEMPPDPRKGKSKAGAAKEAAEKASASKDGEGKDGEGKDGGRKRYPSKSNPNRERRLQVEARKQVHPKQASAARRDAAREDTATRRETAAKKTRRPQKPSRSHMPAGLSGGGRKPPGRGGKR